MSKSDAVNTFGEGLIMDLNPLTTPNNVMTNCLNGTLITFNGNEFVLQNDMGNGRVETAKLPTGFVPVGVKEYGGIIYVASYNPMTKKGQLGSFPSPERNLTQDEISKKQIAIAKSDFCEGDNIKYYYKRIDVMPEGMYLNPGDKFGLFITGTGFDLLSYYSNTHSKAVTFHPAILDDLGNINYIDEECKTDGKYTQGLIFGEGPGDLSSVDGYRAAFEKLLVYKGKRSGKLVLIVELETLDDFIVSRSTSSSKIVKDKIGSTGVGYSDDDGGEDATFKLTFYNSGWPREDNDFIKFTGIRFDSNIDNFELLANGDTISYALDKFKRTDVLKYKITPYTQLGACDALARTGIINFSLFGTGNIIFNEWRYYVENNSLRINYGFDTNLLEGESVKSVTFEFYDVYYNKVYSNKYVCASTINGSYNGSYTEIFKLPYDLNYPDTYSDSLKNKDYIANSVIGLDIPDESGQTLKGKYILKSDELLKNNLYCVKITITTTGLDNEDQSKSFFRFLWTTGYFNEAYIQNQESNFSVLEVPKKYIPKFKPTSSYDTSDSSNFKLNYINNPTRNKAKFPHKYYADQPTETAKIQSNMYQDWELDQAKITITTEIETPPDNTMFGDYNEGWFEISADSKSKVTYSNENQVINTPNGQVSKEASDYVDLLPTDDSEAEPLYKYKEAPALSGLNVDPNVKNNPESILLGTYKTKLLDAVRTGKLDNAGYQKELEALEEINDTQFYFEKDENSSITIKSEENKDTVIEIKDIQGRLIRRLSGDVSSPEFTSVTINELRPCIYKNMPDGELKNLVVGASYDTTNILGGKGNVLLFGGDNKGKPNIFAYWGEDSSYVNDKLLLQNIEAHDGNGLSRSVITRALIDASLNGVIYPAQSSNFNDVSGGQWGALGVGFYTEGSPDPYNPDFKDHFQEDNTRTYTFNSINYRPIVTITLWRTSGSTENNLEFGAINLGDSKDYGRYIQNCLIPLLKAIHILHKNINRELYVEKLSRLIFHNAFATKVNIGVEVDFDAKTQQSGSINITKSPIKLYDGEFKEETVSERLNGIGWEIEKDVWYKSIEDLTTAKNVMQCSYLNIPYGKIISIDETNKANRVSSGAGFVDLDMSNLVSLGENKYMFGVVLNLGGQIDMSTVADEFISYLDGSSSYKPTFIYVPKGDSFDLIDGLDSLGNPLTSTQVYYLGVNGEYVAGNSSEANRVDIFGHKITSQLKNLFIPMTLNGYTVPVLNVSATGNRVEKLSTNISDHNNRKHISDINYYRDVYFTNKTYTPLLV